VGAGRLARRTRMLLATGNLPDGGLVGSELDSGSRQDVGRAIVCEFSCDNPVRERVPVLVRKRNVSNRLRLAATREVQ
jgi:hypothetical protein